MSESDRETDLFIAAAERDRHPNVGQAVGSAPLEPIQTRAQHRRLRGSMNRIPEHDDIDDLLAEVERLRAALGRIDSPPRHSENKEDDTRVAPSVPCVERIGSTAEQPTGAVTAEELTEEEPEWFPNEGDRRWWREQQRRDLRTGVIKMQVPHVHTGGGSQCDEMMNAPAVNGATVQPNACANAAGSGSVASVPQTISGWLMANSGNPAIDSVRVFLHEVATRVEQIRNQLDAAINLVPAKEPWCLLDRIDRDLRQLKKDIGQPSTGLFPGMPLPVPVVEARPHPHDTNEKEDV